MDPPELAEIEAFVGVGSVLAGKYRIERVLGVGGMGAVVAAHHEQLRERVAIKLLLSRPGHSERLSARFLQEARTASKLKSPHVARVFDIDTRADGTPFIVMEYLEGETLSSRFRRDRALSAASIVDDVLEACVALAEAHALGIVHRDLKPANLFAAEERGGPPSVRVLDFGISKVLQPSSSDEPITQDLPIGSPPYMSPEQLTQPASVDHRTDIWSLGVVLYEGLTGRLPFGGTSFVEMSANVLQRSPEPISEASELDGVVRRCLIKERDRRLPSVEALAQLLSPHAGERGRRALGLLERWQRSHPPASRAAALVETSATGREVRHEVGTATGTAVPTQAPAPRARGFRRSVWALGVAVAAAVAVVAMYRSDLNGTPTSASGAPVSSESIAPSPTGSSVAALSSAVAVPPPSASTAAPPSIKSAVASPSSRPHVRGGDGPTPALGRGGAAPRAFDPVFDERR